MHWHLQPFDLHARGFDDGDGIDGQDCYDREKSYFVIATVQLLGKGKANIIAHLRAGDQISQRDYRKLLLKLYKEYGVTKVRWVHEGKESEHDTAPAPL